jgi:hypothetical protein
MSVSLCCPNCGRVIGEASHEDGYINHYHHKNEKGEPVCPTCGTGSNKVNNILLVCFFIAALFAISAVFLSK